MEKLPLRSHNFGELKDKLILNLKFNRILWSLSY